MAPRRERIQARMAALLRTRASLARVAGVMRRCNDGKASTIPDPRVAHWHSPAKMQMQPCRLRASYHGTPIAHTMNMRPSR